MWSTGAAPDTRKKQIRAWFGANGFYVRVLLGLVHDDEDNPLSHETMVALRGDTQRLFQEAGLDVDRFLKDGVVVDGQGSG